MLASFMGISNLTLTEDQYKTYFIVNYLSHFLLF